MGERGKGVVAGGTNNTRKIGELDPIWIRHYQVTNTQARRYSMTSDPMPPAPMTPTF